MAWRWLFADGFVSAAPDEPHARPHIHLVSCACQLTRAGALLERARVSTKSWNDDQLVSSTGPGLLLLPGAIRWWGTTCIMQTSHAASCMTASARHLSEEVTLAALKKAILRSFLWCSSP